MYLLTTSPHWAIDYWEATGNLSVIFSTPSNEWFDDETFPRVKTIEEFTELVKQDYALFKGQRGNPQKEAEDAIADADKQ